MYVDGVSQGSLGGQISLTGVNHFYVGAGFLGGAWPSESHRSGTDNTGYATYFNGNISDFAFFDKALSPAQISLMYQSGRNPSSPLATITKPLGGQTAAVSYDKTSALVTAVT